MTDLINFLKDHNACEEGYNWVLAQPDQSLEAIWKTCPRGDWLLWLHEEVDTPWDVLEPVVYRAVNRAFEYAGINFGPVTPENVGKAIKTARAVGAALTLATIATEAAEAARAAKAAHWSAKVVLAAIATEHLLCANDCRKLLELPKI